MRSALRNAVKLAILLLLAASFATSVAAGEPRKTMPDDPQAVESLKERGAWLRWGGDESVWEVTFHGISNSSSRGDVRANDSDLESLRGLHHVKILTLKDAQITDRGAAELAGHVELQDLDLSGANISDEGLAHLAQLPRLVRLSLRGTSISDDGLAHLRSIKTLKSLSLDGAEIGDAGLVHLSGLDRLELLSLKSTNVTDAGLIHLKGLKRLNSLTLDGTEVTDAGLVHLKYLKRLQGLGLDDTDVTDAGMVHLGQLASLRGLGLRDTDVTAKGVKKLRQMLPDLGYVDYEGDQQRSKRDDEAKMAENQRVLRMVKAGDLAGFKTVVEKNPAAVHFEWIGELTKAGSADDEMTALQLAVRHADLPMVQFLVEHGADLDAKTNIALPALSLAAEKGDLSVVKYLLAHGAAVKSPEFDCYSDVWDDSPLNYAATKEIAAALIAAGADARATSLRHTPLHHARNREIAELLIAHGAHVNVFDDDVTPLYYAISSGRLDVARSLIEHGADVNATIHGEPLLALVVGAYGPEPIKMLLKAGARIPLYKTPMWTLLHSAAADERAGSEVIEILLKAGLKVDAVTSDFENEGTVPTPGWSNAKPSSGIGRRTPLHVAIQVGNLEAAKTLIARGADVHAKTADGETPLSLTKWVEPKGGVSYQLPSFIDHKRYYEDCRTALDNRNAARKAIGELLRSKAGY
jgi:ankyrin repeat protein